MVAAAKIEREAVEKKNEQLRSQVRDTESLLASHQDQLAELKSVMQGMQRSKDDVDSRATSTAPSSPAGPPQRQGTTTQESTSRRFVAASSNSAELAPGPSCNFPDIIRMVCRTDLSSYDDFRELLTLAQSSKPPSRAGSGSYAGLNVISLAGFGSGAISANNSPTKGITSSPNGSLSSQFGSHIPLKDTRFYKRVLMEDIEPTLRLDMAPGISWLTRRTVLSGICEGTLVVEPMPAMTKKYEFPCTVCGDRRPGPQSERTHRFRTSESETAQRYSLCLQCLERIRSCCEFTGYLRLILDGHIKAGDIEEEKDIWEETVRLRERMFWSRIAGGIIPLVSRVCDGDIERADFGDCHAVISTTASNNEHSQLTTHVISEGNSSEKATSPEPSHSQRDSSVFAPSLPDFEMAKSPPLDSHHIDDQSTHPASDSCQRRNSIDSDISVYEEAEEPNPVVTPADAKQEHIQVELAQEKELQGQLTKEGYE